MPSELEVYEVCARKKIEKNAAPQCNCPEMFKLKRW